MPTKAIKFENLLLDLENPRITKATSQREALQRILEDQESRLAVLAESIIKQGGLNPMDRWLVLPADEKGKYVVYEGNRRLSAIRILNNPAVLGGLEVKSAVKKRLESAAKDFDPKLINPIDCYVLRDRQEGALWLSQRHTGANKGSGIVDWGGLATARFRGSNPALQALDAVVKFGGLPPEDAAAVQDSFPITTLDRLLSTPAVRKTLGLDVQSSKLLTDLPASEALRPLRRMVIDLANGTINVTRLKLKGQQVEYVQSLGKDLPNLTEQSGDWTPIDEWDESTFAEPQDEPSEPGGGGKGRVVTPKKKRRRSAERKTLITRDCVLNVTNPKVAEIEEELRSLKLGEHRHAIAVLFRVFLEASVDVYLTKAKVPLTAKDKSGHVKDKSLRVKVSDTITALVAAGAVRKSLDGVAKGIHDPKNALNIDTLHAYVHNQFYSPKESDLTTAFDNSRPFFEAIWK